MDEERQRSAKRSQTSRDALVYDRIWAREGIPEVAASFRDLAAHLPHPPDGLRALDLCSGSGRHALALAEHGVDVLAVDHSARAVAVLREAAQRRGLAVPVLEADAFTWLAEADGRFDVVICFDALHHAARSADHAVELVRLIAGAVRPEGRLLLSFLCDIRYSSGEIPTGRLLVARPEAEAILATALAPHGVTEHGAEVVDEPDTFSLHPVTNELVKADYRATRLVRSVLVRPGAAEALAPPTGTAGPVRS